ncbi:cytochrome P450 monooxygenase [Aspergillus steynii IBT 23096]|uniref:Cytochrome P450 monooxygenase n=1 Tax=Aspergillus steynii IBT 23096 TaxID=1392250 RepID=A0A2I2G778_9EURO|nr:cytochrome P450 monooxygenase [Aspergillus steynii IBT 23096]PLB48736.1 cytochrome P450 monooxygenase [Aspergillus steynii IBT 23096]
MLLETSHKLLALGGISGVSAQVLVYRYGEWDVKAPALFVSYASLLLGAVVVEFVAGQNVAPLASIVLCHVAGIYLSMLVYRAFYHPLAKFPGPFLARLSNFYVTALSAKKLQLYNEVQKLHEQYGDIVRIAPTELSIIDPKAVKALHGAGSKAGKGIWYTVLEPRMNLHMDRDKKSHTQRRRIWDQGFKPEALRCYEPRITLYTDQLLAAIDKRLGTTMDMTTWFNYLSFDVMGDMAFGKSFDMLNSGKDAYLLKQVHEDMKMLGLFSHLTWLLPFFKRIPGINADYVKQWKWITSHVERRVKNRPDMPDVFSFVLDAFEKGPKTQVDYNYLLGDAYLVVVAGSDTTAVTMSGLFFNLVRDQALYKALQKELEPLLPDLSYDRLADCSLLNAAINEALRLHPAVPSGAQRMTPPEGMMIGDTYIPGNTLITIPVYTFWRDERMFARPNEFLPERWTTQPELVKDPAAFTPFNIGSHSCVGKQFGLMELRRVIAAIVTHYDVSFAPGQTEPAYLDATLDAFTAAPAPLQVVFSKRQV